MLNDMLNRAIAMELQVSIQYMWQHVLWSGVSGFAVKDELRKIAIEEMRHAEDIAERLVYLGGYPTTVPAPVFIGESLRDMLERDAGDEEVTIAFYKEIIEVARSKNDLVTANLFVHILSDEERHHDTFITLLEGVRVEGGQVLAMVRARLVNVIKRLG
jgi:bacterioferritin